MLPLFPFSCLYSLIAVRYAVSVNSHAVPPVLRGRSLSSNSTVKVNESVGLGNCPQYLFDDELCALEVGDVDIYYWPDPSRDTSCLSVIGNATNPPMQDASTRTIYGPFYNNSMYTTVYWGCTAWDSTSGESYITTAVLATTGSLSAKQYLYNPWASQPCSAEAFFSTSSISQTMKDRGSHASARVRRHALLASSGKAQNSSLLGATITSGTFTFTSPSIYVDFHEVSVANINGDAVCATFQVSMLTFSPGELSTVEGLHQDPSLLNLGAGLTKVFNFSDLPCPPRSVMEANWYTPEPGQPYRPLLALPRQLQAWNPAFTNCKNIFFNGYDPPRALVPAAAMVPVVTQADSQPSPMPPRPSATPHPGPKETDPASIRTPASVHNPKVPQSPQQSGFQSESGDESLGSKPVMSLTAGQLTTLNGQLIQQLSTGILVAGTTLTPGAPPVKVSGTPISLGPSAVIIGSSSIPIALPRLPWVPGPITNIAGEAVQPLSNGVSVAGTTLTPGGAALTISGTTMSLDSNALVIGTNSILLATDDPTRLVTTVAGQTITAYPNAVHIGSSKLSPGSPGLILSGTLVSLDSAGQLVVGSETIPLERAGGGSSGDEIVTTVAGQYLTANPTAVRIASSTLTPGGPGMTLSGTMISLDSSGRLVIGATTRALHPSIGDLGGLIVGDFQSGESGSVGSGNIASSKNGTGKYVQAFQGNAKSLQRGSAGILLPWLLCAFLIRLYG